MTSPPNRCPSGRAALSRTEGCRAPTEPETYEGLRGAELDREIEGIDALLAEGAAPGAAGGDPRWPWPWPGWRPGWACCSPSGPCSAEPTRTVSGHRPC
ncbi:hypothetical protein ACR6C2_25300 [Streptomyces sp. INA 01156]